jgi:hypothetical protein
MQKQRIELASTVTPLGGGQIDIKQFELSVLQNLCEFLSFRNGAADDSFVLAYDAASVGSRIPTFRENVEFSCPKFDPSNLAEET